DKILSLDGKPTGYFHDFRKLVQSNKNKEVQLQVLRDGDTSLISAHIPESGIMGIYSPDARQFFDVKNVSYTLLEAIPAGFRKSIETLESYWLQLKLIFSGKVNTNE